MPITGARTSASQSGANGAASAPAAVAPSVTATVQNTPKRAPSGPQTNFPIAPPTKTSVSASPMVPIGAPFAGRAWRAPLRGEPQREEGQESGPRGGVDHADPEQDRKAGLAEDGRGRSGRGAGGGRAARGVAGGGRPGGGPRRRERRES